MKKFLVVLCILGCYGCLALSRVSSSSAPEQRFFFEMNYANSAWGHQHRGVYIDADGEMYAYDYRDAVWEPADPAAYTEDELRQKFESQKEHLGTVEAATFRRMTDLIAGAAQGMLSRPISRCNDAGTITYLAYQFDRDTGTYRPVLLYQAGDWAQKNLSADANTLAAWLFTFEGWQPGACLP